MGEFFNLIESIFDIKDDRYKNDYNESKAISDSNKKFADKMAECEFQIKNEKDPLKKEKMKNRLALGVTDFSDL